MIWLLLLFISFIGTVLLTPLVMTALKRYNFWNALDSERKVQVVRGGGLAIIVIFFLVALFAVFFYDKQYITRLRNFSPAALVLVVTGIIDDRFGIPAKVKLLLQISTFAILWFFGFRIESFFDWHMPLFLSLCLTVFWGISVLNAFNLIDGLDGLCAGTGMFAAGAMMICCAIAGNAWDMHIAAILVGCCIGFLCYNFHPAKLFLGDTGSLFLGLVCAILSIDITGGNFNMIHSIVCVLLFWLPLFDTGLAIWRRRVKAWVRRSNKTKVMERDHLHIHYRLLGVVHNHAVTVVILWGVMAAIDALVILIFSKHNNGMTLCLFVLVLVVSLIIGAQYEMRYTNCFIRYAGRRLWNIINASSRIPLDEDIENYSHKNNSQTGEKK